MQQFSNRSHKTSINVLASSAFNVQTSSLAHYWLMLGSWTISHQPEPVHLCPKMHSSLVMKIQQFIQQTRYIAETSPQTDECIMVGWLRKV